MILGVAGSSPVSHPFASLVGSYGPNVADIRLGESAADYHGDLHFRNCSSAKTALESIPLYHARHVARSLPGVSNAAVAHGSLLHQWLEEGDPVLRTWAVCPDEMLTPTGLVGKEGKKWLADNFPPDATVVSPSEFAQLQREISAIKANRAAADLIERTIAREVSVRWLAGSDLLRCRFDAVTSSGLVVDLKTTREADVHKTFWKSVLDFKYHVSDAWYQRGMEACGIEPRPLRYIVVSTVAPHDCQVVTLPPAVIAEGRRLMDAVLGDLRLRYALDWWLPDHHGEVRELEFPAYALEKMR